MAVLKKRNRKLAIILSAAAALAVAIIILVSAVIMPGAKYNDAMVLMNAGEHDQAIAAFTELSGYSDADVQVSEVLYRRAKAMMDAGENRKAMAAFEKLEDHKDARERRMEALARATKREIVSAGVLQTVSLRSDGKVVAAGGRLHR